MGDALFFRFCLRSLGLFLRGVGRQIPTAGQAGEDGQGQHHRDDAGAALPLFVFHENVLLLLYAVFRALCTPLFAFLYKSDLSVRTD